MTGRFHDLTVLSRRTVGRGVTCSCCCVCGVTLDVPLSDLRDGNKRSCGCRTGEVYRATRRANDRDALRAVQP